MSARLNLIQLNVEMNRHLEPITAFLGTRKPDVACLQEVALSSVPLLEKTLGASCFFVPMGRFRERGMEEIIGTGILSRHPVRKSFMQYYVGSGLPDAFFDGSMDSGMQRKTKSNALSWCEVEKDGHAFRIATTHLPWTANGQPDEFQHADIRNLIRLLDAQGEFVLCGDFNAPRGGEAFGLLAERFTDNIPSAFTSSLDKNLHRAGHLKLMVDGIFSTKGYRISDVERVCGISDHCAFTGAVEKV